MAVTWGDQSQGNPNPFGGAENQGEVKDWAEGVSSADANDAGKSSFSQAEQISHEQSHDNSLKKDESLLKTATHAAKRKLRIDSLRTAGPLKFFNPTNVHIRVNWEDESQPLITATHNEAGQPSGQTVIWRARDNRKGRASIAVPTSAASRPKTSRKTRCLFQLSKVGSGFFRCFTSFPYWDIAFWSGFSYTIGSILFVMDGAWVWSNVAFPGSQPEEVLKYGPGLDFFIGALFYQVGATTAYLEAINDGSFQGSAMRRLLQGHEEDSKKMVDEKVHHFFGHFVPHHHHKSDGDVEKAAGSIDPEAGWRTKDRQERPGSIYPAGKGPAPRRGGLDLGQAEEGQSSEYMTWRWWPTWHGLKTHHLREIGYVSCTIQLFGATLYGICGVVDIPGIIDTLEPWQEEGAFWVPQIVASCCFLTAGIGFTLETQERWYRPEPLSVGWWIGVWATVGSVGFL